jgi:hypothetical protein
MRGDRDTGEFVQISRDAWWTGANRAGTHRKGGPPAAGGFAGSNIIRPIRGRGRRIGARPGKSFGGLGSIGMQRSFSRGGRGEG